MSKVIAVTVLYCILKSCYKSIRCTAISHGRDVYSGSCEVKMRRETCPSSTGRSDTCPQNGGCIIKDG